MVSYSHVAEDQAVAVTKQTLKTVGTSPGVVGKGVVSHADTGKWEPVHADVVHVDSLGTSPGIVVHVDSLGTSPGIVVHVDSMGTSPGIVEKAVVSHAMATDMGNRELVHVDVVPVDETARQKSPMWDLDIHVPSLPLVEHPARSEL